MSKNSFHAMNWLSTRRRSNSSLESKTPYSCQDHNKKFNPSNHLTPGWQGDGLGSKEGSRLKRAFLILWRDAVLQILQ